MQALHFNNYMTRHELQTMGVWSSVKFLRVSRKISGRGFQRVKMRLFQIQNADKIIDPGIAGKAMRYLPKSVWGGFFRIRRIHGKMASGK